MSSSTYPTATPAAPTANPRVLQAGQRKSHPSYIPEYLPSFPDPHTYIKTPVGHACGSVTHFLPLTYL